LSSRTLALVSDIGIRFQNLGTGSRSDISDTWRIYPMHPTYPAFGRVQKLSTSFRSDISDPERTYLMYQTYPASDRVLEPCHQFQVRYIRPRADISDASDMFGFRSSSKTLAARSGRIYPTSIRYIRLGRNHPNQI
jgi:hypothetical protein